MRGRRILSHSPLEDRRITRKALVKRSFFSPCPWLGSFACRPDDATNPSVSSCRYLQPKNLTNYYCTPDSADSVCLININCSFTMFSTPSEPGEPRDLSK